MNEKSKEALKERTRTTNEIYRKTYPIESIMENPLKGIEAIGWLKCTKQYVPYLSKWIDAEIGMLLAVIPLFAIKED